MPDTDLPLVLTVEEAAKVLRVSKWSLYEVIKRGDIPVLRLGRSIRLSRDTILRLLEEGT